MQSPFDFEKYTKYLNYLLNEERRRGRGWHRQLAEAMGCQASLLSAVLANRGHLTRDHLANLADFLKLSLDESDYLLLLLDEEKASSPVLKVMIQKKKQELQIKHNKIKAVVKNVESIQAIFKPKYYSSWLYQAVHFVLYLEKHQSPSSIASALRVDEKQVDSVLEFLIKAGMVTEKDKKYYANPVFFHLEESDDSNLINHLNFRHLAIQQISARHQDKDLHYSSIFCVDAAAYEKIRKLILNSIKETRKIMEPAPSKMLGILNIDYFSLVN